MNGHSRSLERAAASFLTRTMIGFVYLFAGVHKLTEFGAVEFGRRMAAAADASRFVPGSIVMAAGTLTPFLELGLGALVLVGLWTRPALRCLAVLIVFVTVACGVDGLLHPMGAAAIDITVVNLDILPRAALLMITLFLPADEDLLSVDALRDGRARRLLAGRPS